MMNADLMKHLVSRVVAKASQDALFQALAYAALKARAGRIAPNQILRSGDFELIVAHDENGEGLVVQMMLPLVDLEAMVLSHAAALEPASEHWSEGERREFLGGILAELARYLARWQGIVMRRGPGEDVTLEMAVSG
ncbi:MAG: hypothetical protein MUE87_04010 [Methanothrix sp.]|nr:hypothetical protein [Methanothrix sp.]